jgi:hypothetical protein
MLDADIVARWIYDRTFCALQWPPGPAELLHRLVGGHHIAIVDEPYSVARDLHGFRVIITRSLAPELLCMQFGSAVATVGRLLRQEAVGSDEQVRRIASAIVMPKPALRRALRSIGPRVEGVAQAFVVPLDVARDRICALGLRLASGEFRHAELRGVG